MSSVKYSIRYLPLFYNDLEEQVMYISEVLCNKDAANHLLDLVEKAILDRCKDCGAVFDIRMENPEALTEEK